MALHSLYLRTVRSRTLQVRLLIRTTHYYPGRIYLTLQPLLIVAKSNLIATDNTHLFSDTTSHIHEFPVNSFALVHYRSGKPPTRLHTVWKGPMRVLSGTDSRYLLLDRISLSCFRYEAFHPRSRD